MACGFGRSDGGHTFLGSGGPTCLFRMYSVSSQVAARQTDDNCLCEHINPELWLDITFGFTHTVRVGINKNVAEIVQCIPDLRGLKR